MKLTQFNPKKLLLSTAFMVGALFSTAQVTYKTLNKTNELAPFKVSLSFLSMENLLHPITAGIMVEGQIMNKLFYNVQFRQGYLRNFNVNKEALITSNKESKGTTFEAGGDWVFRDKVKQGTVKVVTSSSFDGQTTRESFFKAKCDVRKLWALSGGVIMYIRPTYVNSDTFDYIISGSTEIKAPKDQFTHFNESTFGIYGGLSHRKIRKAIVNSGGYNYRRFYSKRFYMHALIGATKASDVIYNNTRYKIDNAKQMPLGYRIGWQWDEMGVVTGLEFGKIPGVHLETPVEKTDFYKIFLNNQFLNYVRITFQFNVFNSDRNYKMKNLKPV